MNNSFLDYTLEVKTLNKQGVFTGYASVYGVIDNHDDIILPNAFAESLEENPNIKLLWQHKADEPIGVFTHIEEDETGLYVEGKLLFEVERAREAYALLKSGALRGLSIGFKVNDYDVDDEGIRIIKKAELFEISLVTFPANDSAKILSVKSSDKNPPKIKFDSEISSEAELLTSLDRAIGILLI